MNQAFLNALKVKSLQIQTKRTDEPQAGKVYAITGNNGQNMASGTPIADCEVKDADPIINPDNRVTIKQSKPIVLVCYIADRQRIDLIFPDKPSHGCRDAMKDMGFRFDPIGVTWYGKDNSGNRNFAESLGAFGYTVQIDSKSDRPEQSTSAFETYKKQCAELCEHLDLDPADLAIEAIKHFHSHTFDN